MYYIYSISWLSHMHYDVKYGVGENASRGRRTIFSFTSELLREMYNVYSPVMSS